MIGLDELIRRFAELDNAELARWIDNRWVLPEQPGEDGRTGEPGGQLQFREVDIARVELILHIRREFEIDEDSLSLVLGLLDQVYSLRRQMHRLCDAIECQPPAIRDAIRRALPPMGEDR